jgi:hypothetical protein
MKNSTSNPPPAPSLQLETISDKPTAVERAGRLSLPTINIETLINKAVDSKAAVEVVKELRAMLREDQAIAAKAAFDEAMSRFQAACPVITKSKAVPDRSGATAYRFAPIEKVEEIIRPVERENGFTHTFDQDVSSLPGWVIASCKITHDLGHSETKTVKLPLGTRTAIMSDTQQYAAALTFANRRVLANAYGLVFAGEDKDGGSAVKPAGPSTMRPPKEDLKPLAQELWDLLKPVRGTKQDWTAANQWLWREDILDGAIPEEAPALSADKFREVIKKVRARIVA